MYSEEEGTWGAEHFADDVPEEEKQRRLDLLMQQQADISLAFNKGRVGSVERVMVDSVAPGGKLVCRSQYESPEVDGEIIVAVPAGTNPDALPGQFITVRITGADLYVYLQPVLVKADEKGYTVAGPRSEKMRLELKGRLGQEKEAQT